jgi:hypothetical protein
VRLPPESVRMPEQENTSLALNVARIATADATEAKPCLACEVVGALGTAGEMKTAASATTIRYPTIGWRRPRISVRIVPQRAKRQTVWLMNMWRVIPRAAPPFAKRSSRVNSWRVSAPDRNISSSSPSQ